MKQKIQMTLDEENIKHLDSLLAKHNITRSKFINSLIKNSIFVMEHIKDNPSYYLVEQILTDFYKMGLISYHDLVKMLGPERSYDIAQIIRTTRKFKEWRNA
jgi:hypothetical protein